MNRREFVALAAVAPFGLRASLLAGAPSALVTCDAEARLAVVDLGALAVTHSIPTLPDPRSVELVGRRAVVCHTAVGALSVIEGHRVARVVRGFEEPRYAVAHPDGVHAWVTDSGRSGVAVVDLERGIVVGRVRLPGWARHLTLGGGGRQLWVGLGSSSEHVAVLDTARLRHVTTLTPGFGAHDVGAAPDGRLWVTGGEAPSIAIGARHLPADLAPQHVTFGAGVAYVTSGAAGILRVLGHDGAVRRTTAIPVGSYNVQYGRGRVITGSLSRGTLTVLDRRGMLEGHVAVAGSCHDACLWP